MKLFILILLVVSLNCSNGNKEFVPQKSVYLNQNVETGPDSNTNSKAEPESKSDYPGVTIDEKFGIIEHHSYEKGKIISEKTVATVEGFDFEFKVFTPWSISRNGKVVSRIKAPSEYSSFSIGVAKLFGDDSKQVFILARTGAVCCSVFWIIDVSSGKPTTIFRSEDFDHYRNGLEVFDAENDGIYEISLSDASFRYIMNDCGSCSPEPRAVFKFDKKKNKYLPVKGIQQNFIKEGYPISEKWIIEFGEKLKRNEEFEESNNYHRSVRAFVVDLIYFGDEKRAWDIFDEYYPEKYDKKENRAEIKKILRKSKYYRSLK